MCFRITRCCCFTNTKDGSFAVGIYTSILSVISIILCAILLGQFESIIGYNNKYGKYVSTGLSEDTIKTNSIVLLISSIICLLVSFLLLYGVKKDERLYLIPWMTWMALVIVGQIVMLILLFISMIYNAYLSIAVAIVGLYTAFDIYCYSCVYSQYKTLTCDARETDGLKQQALDLVEVDDTLQVSTGDESKFHDIETTV